MRPKTLEEFEGQGSIVGPGKVMGGMLDGESLVSLIMWGPPGVGKTTLARIMAARSGAAFYEYSATTSGIRDIREVMKKARQMLDLEGRKTVLFVDEVHRFNRAQQDAFLSFVEDGTITLIGATTENPSFEVNSALLSRCRVFSFQRLGATELTAILDRALSDGDRGLGGWAIAVDDSARDALVGLADGDARQLLNLLELAAFLATPDPEGGRTITLPLVEDALGHKALVYDGSGEQHFNLISALHKSLRGSDADAALYWLVRMLEGGENPLYIARRLVRFASEDVGLADNGALRVALDAYQATQYLGLPEADTALAQTVIYLALAPKSNSVYSAVGKARAAAQEHGSLPVPKAIRNPVTGLMKDMGYGEGYDYPHDDPRRATGLSFLPSEIEGDRFYRPGPFGFEKEMRRRLDYWHRLRSAKRSDHD
jgi:putative ATPase